MRFLVRLNPSTSGKAEFLSTLVGIASNLGIDIKHPRWSSKGSLEVDVFAPSHEDLSLLLAAVEPLAGVESTRNLDEAPAFKTKEEVLREAVEYFNAERYWEAHETLESVWRPALGDERSLIQAIILVCAALVHVQRGEPEVALGIYKRALPSIRWNSRYYHRIDVDQLRDHVRSSLTRRELPPFKL